ncbi:MAG TPA: CYTH domain-containing protein [Candidatus Limnocylindria bacterium]|nr:CYTH domain-containing protein [Candidatus Limnocylindria bacterium]
MATEVEAKFLADGPEPLAQLAAADRLGRAALGPPQAFDEVDRYLDTDDGRLAAAGWACRLRERAGSIRVSLKGPPEPQPAAWLHHRPELEAPATDSIDPGDWAPSEAREAVERLSEGLSLHERFRLIQRRTERSVELDGVPIGTLSLDVVSVRSGETDAGTLFAIELELMSADDGSSREALAELADALARFPGLEPDGRTKLEHALAMIASR